MRTVRRHLAQPPLPDRTGVPAPGPGFSRDHAHGGWFQRRTQPWGATPPTPPNRAPPHQRTAETPLRWLPGGGWFRLFGFVHLCHLHLHLHLLAFVLLLVSLLLCSCCSCWARAVPVRSCASELVEVLLSRLFCFRCEIYSWKKNIFLRD